MQRKEINCDLYFENNKTILHHLDNTTDEGIMKLVLLKHNINVNAQDNNGVTILHISAFNRNEKFINQLLGVPSINPNIKDNSGNTPLYLAIAHARRYEGDPYFSYSNHGLFGKFGESAHCVKSLVSHPLCYINIQNRSGDTPLHIAVRKENKKNLHILLQQQKVL